MNHLATGMLLAVPIALLRAFVVFKLWGWHVVNTFSVPPLTMPQAYGLAVIVAMLTYQMQVQNYRRQTDEEESMQRNLNRLLSFIAPAWFLLLGWVTTLFTVSS